MEDIIVAATSNRIYFLPSSFQPNSILRWEWVTEHENDWGGVVDDNPTALAYSPKLRNLYIGNQRSLSAFDCDTGFFSRIGGDEGLPVNNITSLAINEELNFVWIGSGQGLVLFEPLTNSFRYFAGPRYLVENYVKSVSVDQATHTVTTSHPSGDFISHITPTKMTLDEKSNKYSNLLNKSHRRHGLTAECRYTTPTTCTSSDSDNNGLWTSLVVVAKYLEHAVTLSPTALSTASYFLDGIILLNQITGSSGYFARSVCSPDEIGKTCHVDLDEGKWADSLNHEYQGWIFKTDTSSDEAVGQVFALLAAAKLSPDSSEREIAGKILRGIITHLLDNGFMLIDPTTGLPTTWGKWGPDTVNHDRSFSDTRGLQSLQLISFLAAAASVTPTNSPLFDRIESAYKDLTGEHGYNANIVNTKILSPNDLNYSDDELTFLPYYTFHMAVIFEPDALAFFDADPVMASMKRTFAAVKPLKSSLWNAIYLAVSDEDEEEDIVNDMIYNLATWPLDMIDHTTYNGARIDILMEPGEDRFVAPGMESTKTRPPLPANERRQFRWNRSPYEVADGGDVVTEYDPGAWLLSYWLAQYHNLI